MLQPDPEISQKIEKLDSLRETILDDMLAGKEVNDRLAEVFPALKTLDKNKRTHIRKSNGSKNAGDNGSPADSTPDAGSAGVH